MNGRLTPESVTTRTSTDCVLELRDASRTHSSGATAVHALRGISLRVSPGELVAVMGPSGSGKSTLLHLAGGLDDPSDGSVFVEGVELGSLDRTGLAALRRRSVGYVFQDEARHAAWADRVVFLRDGSLVDDTGPTSTPEELLADGSVA